MSYQDVAPNRLNELLDSGYQLIDVREPFEVSRRSHPSARNIPLGELPSRLNEIDRTKPVAVVCQSGGRSASAASLLVKSGFSRVVNISGGMSAVR